MSSTKAVGFLYRVILSAILALTTIGAHAQTSTPSPTPTQKAQTPPKLESQFFKNILRDQKAIWTSPGRLKKGDARWLVPLGVGTAALIATDRETGDAIGDFRDQLKPSRVISYAGDTYTLGAVAGSFYLIGRVKNNARARETGVLSAEALVDAYIVVHTLKAISQRARPLSGRERSKFFVGGMSFPSGHSMQVWALATVIANEYHDRLAVQITAYGIATAVSISRFTGRKHYLSDVLVGGAIGYGIGKYVYSKRHKDSVSGKDDDEEARSFKRWPLIAPYYGGRAREYGVTLRWSF